MGKLEIEGLRDSNLAALKARAEAAGRTPEDEALRIIEEATRDAAEAIDRADRIAYVEELRALRKELFGDRLFPSAVEALRRARNGDPTRSEDEGEAS